MTSSEEHASAERGGSRPPQREVARSSVPEQVLGRKRGFPVFKDFTGDSRRRRTPRWEAARAHSRQRDLRAAVPRARCPPHPIQQTGVGMDGGAVGGRWWRAKEAVNVQCHLVRRRATDARVFVSRRVPPYERRPPWDTPSKGAPPEESTCAREGRAKDVPRSC